MIYLDNAATTKVDPEAVEIMNKIYLEDFGNPSSLYDFGFKSEKHMNKARDLIAEVLKASTSEIFFTSCGSESNNIAILSQVTGNKNQEFITDVTEHSSVEQVFSKIEEKYPVHYINVDEKGFVSVDDIIEKINENTKLVSIMAVNNELGSVQPIEQIGIAIKKKNPKTLFHVDGIQSFGKIPLDLNKAKVDLFSISAHKLHGPKGVGALFARKGTPLKPVILGGGQENNISSGTENVAGIAALGFVASKAYQQIEENFKRLAELKEYLFEELSVIEDIKMNSTIENGSPYITNICFKDIKSEVLIHFLEQDEIYVSSGSACKKDKKSRVLEGIKIKKEYEEGCIRISFSDLTTREEVERFLDKLKEAVEEIRKIIRRK